MKLNALFLAASLAAAAPWTAMATTDGAANTGPSAPASTAGYTDAEVKKVDAEQGKVTLKHGPIEALGMPGMTMVFRADPALLAKVKPGDLVKFKADRVDGSFKVTDLAAR